MTANKTLHVGRPNVGDRQALFQRINEMLDRKWLTNNGPLVQELEEKLARYLGVRHCITLCNGTVALQMAIRALELTGEVIVPSLTFIATPHALQWQGITPVFCDINPMTYCIDPAKAEKLITSKTSGILAVHLYGNPAPIKPLRQLADQYKLNLLFDAAHAFGCSYQGEMIGAFGECEIFSFHATKFFNTFEGGAVTTNSDDLAEKIRLMKNFGFSDLDRVDCLGSNGKMSEISAAMGLTGMEAQDEVIAVNRRIYRIYQKEFENIAGISLFQFDESERCNYQYIVAEITAPFPLSRDELMKSLHEKDILVRRYFWPGCHNMEPYRTINPHAGDVLKVTEQIAERLLVFPTGCSIEPDDIRRIVTAIHGVI